MANDMRMQAISEEAEAFKKQLEKERAEEQMTRSQQQFDKKIDQLADLALEYTNTRGLQDPLTVMLTTFLDVAIRMKEMMKTVQAISVAMSCVTEAIEFLDSANDLDAKMMEGTLQHKYGLIARIRQHFMYKRVIRNHKNRIKQFAKGMASKFKMAQEMVSAMETFALTMQKSFHKKKKGKGENAAAEPGISPATQQYLQQRAAANGVTFSSEGAAADAPAAAGGENGRRDDIF